MTESILVVDDDDRFRERLLKALHARGISASGATGYREALAAMESQTFGRAIVDLKMPEKSGLEVIRGLLERAPELEIIVLTAYGSIATAVEAIRLGARDYLTKPCDADRILAGFEIEPAVEATLAFETPSLARVEWEHIERVLREHNGNISRAARALGINRRTLQYKLAKRPVPR